jgi:hypothetical protein
MAETGFICRHCGSPFFASAPRTYCSPSCALDALRPEVRAAVEPAYREALAEAEKEVAEQSRRTKLRRP